MIITSFCLIAWSQCKLYRLTCVQNLDLATACMSLNMGCCWYCRGVTAWITAVKSWDGLLPVSNTQTCTAHLFHSIKNKNKRSDSRVTSLRGCFRSLYGSCLKKHLFFFVPPQRFASFIYICDCNSGNPTATLSVHYITI